MKFITILMLSLVLACMAFAEESKPETGRIAVIETSKGAIIIALYEKDAPITTANFIELVKRKFYDGLKFHRVVPGFVIQGGDPNGNGSGGSGKTIKLETSPKLKHGAAGAVAMARTPNPDSATSQFYITLGDTESTRSLDGGYAVFGRVIEGLDVVKKIQQGDIIKTIRIIPKPEPKEKIKKTEDKKPADK